MSNSLSEVKRIGPDTPDNSMVICPHCTSQFQAICVDDQKQRASMEAEIARLTSALKAIDTAFSNTDYPDRESEAHFEAIRDIALKALRASNASNE